MDSRQLVFERLLTPLHATLETYDDKTRSWHRVHVTLGMNLWWVNDTQYGKRKKKFNPSTLLRFGKDLNMETGKLLKGEIGSWNSDEYLALGRRKYSGDDSLVKWLPRGDRGQKAFRVVSGGKHRLFRSHDEKVAERWKRAIELRLMPWEELVTSDGGFFKELLGADFESSSRKAAQENYLTGTEKIGGIKTTRMQCSEFLLEELDAVLPVGIKAERTPEYMPNMLQTAADIVKFLSKPPYVGYAFRIFGLGLEFAIKLREEWHGLREAQELLQEIAEKAVRALTYAKNSGYGIVLPDLFMALEKYEESIHELELHCLSRSARKPVDVVFGEVPGRIGIIAPLRIAHKMLSLPVSLTYAREHDNDKRFRLIYDGKHDGDKGALPQRAVSKNLSKGISPLTPWPDEIPMVDDGSYVGNSYLLTQIHETLAKGRSANYPADEIFAEKCIVSSPAGMGKTELVKQYARINRKVYHGGVYWVQAEKESTLINSFQKIKKQIRRFAGYGSEADSANIVHAPFRESGGNKQLQMDCKKIFRSLSRDRGAWLIIFDGADEIEGDRDFLLKLLPSLGRGDVLVTTRLSPLSQNLHEFQKMWPPVHVTDALQKLEVADARSLLLFHAGIRDRKELCDLENHYVARIVGPGHLDGHPLAIVQAGRYIKETSLSFNEFAQYLALADVPGKIIPGKGKGIESVNRSITKTILEPKNILTDAAKELLSVLCWLNPDGVAEDDLRELSDPSINAFPNSSLQKHFEGTEKDSDDYFGLGRRRKWIRLIEEVCKYGLIQLRWEGDKVLLSTHRLVYAMERETLLKPQEEARLKGAIVTTIMLLQYHVERRKKKLNTTLPFAFKKDTYFRLWKTANLFNQLGYILGRYDIYSNTERIRFYQYAADLKNPTAIFNLGVLYRDGKGVRKDEKHAVELFERAAELRDPDAMHGLGNLYRDGRGVEQDEEHAVELFGEATQLGSVPAMNNLGRLYEEGKGVEKDERRSARLYLSAAILGSAPAANNLGRLYEEGKGVEKDERRSAELYERASELGSAPATNNLGRLYEEGKGVEKDERRSAEVYEKASELGSASAMNNLGRLYEEGKGVQKDERRSAELYGIASELGDPLAIKTFDRLHEEGKGVEKDERRSAELYRKASELGDPFAMNNLGRLSVEGKRMEKREKLADKLSLIKCWLQNVAGKVEISKDIKELSSLQLNYRDSEDYEYDKINKIGNDLKSGSGLDVCACLMVAFTETILKYGAPGIERLPNRVADETMNASTAKEFIQWLYSFLNLRGSSDTSFRNPRRIALAVIAGARFAQDLLLTRLARTVEIILLLKGENSRQKKESLSTATHTIFKGAALLVERSSQLLEKSATEFIQHAEQCIKNELSIEGLSDWECKGFTTNESTNGVQLTVTVFKEPKDKEGTDCNLKDVEGFKPFRLSHIMFLMWGRKAMPELALPVTISTAARHKPAGDFSCWVEKLGPDDKVEGPQQSQLLLDVPIPVFPSEEQHERIYDIMIRFEEKPSSRLERCPSLNPALCNLDFTFILLGGHGHPTPSSANQFSGPRREINWCTWKLVTPYKHVHLDGSKGLVFCDVTPPPMETTFGGASVSVQRNAFAYNLQVALNPDLAKARARMKISRNFFKATSINAIVGYITDSNSLETYSVSRSHRKSNLVRSLIRSKKEIFRFGRQEADISNPFTKAWVYNWIRSGILYGYIRPSGKTDNKRVNIGTGREENGTNALHESGHTSSKCLEEEVPYILVLRCLDDLSGLDSHNCPWCSNLRGNLRTACSTAEGDYAAIDMNDDDLFLQTKDGSFLHGQGADHCMVLPHASDWYSLVRIRECQGRGKEQIFELVPLGHFSSEWMKRIKKKEMHIEDCLLFSCPKRSSERETHIT